MRYFITSQSLLNLCSMQSIIWFLARWSRTYLMSSDGIGEKILDSGHHHEHSSKKTLLCFFGEHNQGKLVLDIIVRIAFITLTSYPGEKDLQVWVYHSNNFGHSLLHIVVYLVWISVTKVMYISKFRRSQLQSLHAYLS